MIGDALAVLDYATGDGTIWIISDNSIGNPSFSSNNINWNTAKGIACAPLGDKKYQIKLIAGETVKTNAVNFKFFHQRGWGGEFKKVNLSFTKDIFEIPADDGNIRLATGKTLEEGKLYVFTVDINTTPATLTVTVE